MRECRAIILDRDNDWKVVSYPYNKFFNYGEKWADPIGQLRALKLAFNALDNNRNIRLE